MKGELFGRPKPTAIQRLISAAVNQRAERRAPASHVEFVGVCLRAERPYAHSPSRSEKIR